MRPVSCGCSSSGAGARPAALGRSARRLSAALLVLLLAVAASACGSSGGPSGEKVSAGNLPKCPLNALKKAKGTINVTLWHGLANQPKAALEKLVSQFNAQQAKAHTPYHIKVTAQIEGKSYDEVWDKYTRAASSKQLPGIVQLEDTRLSALADSGLVLPAASCAKADGTSFAGQYPAVRNYWSVRGVYWPGAIETSEPVLYYNKAHFVKAGLDPNKPPSTLDELERDAKALKKAGIPSPLSLKLDSWFLQSWLNGEGVDVVDHDNGLKGEPTKAVYDTPEAKKLLAFFTKMKKEGLVAPVAKTSGGIDQFLNVATQKSSMLIESSGAATSIAAFLKGNTQDLKGVKAGNTSGLVPGAGPFPGVREPAKVRVSGFGFFIDNTTSPAVQAASWEFLKFMSQPASQVTWLVTGSYLPGVKSVASLPQAADFFSKDRAGQLVKVANDQLTKIDPANPGPHITDYATFQQSLQKMWESIMFNGTPIDKALSSSEKQVTDALQQYRQQNG